MAGDIQQNVHAVIRRQAGAVKLKKASVSHHAVNIFPSATVTYAYS